MVLLVQYRESSVFTIGCSSILTVLAHAQATGALVTDNNEGLCPQAAVNNCAERRSIMRARALPRAPATPVPAAREVKPGLMEMRARLGEKKRLNKKH